MNELNNIYNFKNNIRYFVNISDLNYTMVITNINYLSWTTPISVRLKKKTNDNTISRLIKMPNILNFYACFSIMKNKEIFYDISTISDHSRMTAQIETGDFKKNSYSSQIQSDFLKLSLYDFVLKMDIKSFYDGIYTHDIKFNDSFNDRYIANLNEGKTNGIILGSYISLYVAECYLKKISEELEREIESKNINCFFEYFSDDFYFFCNKEDVDIIKNLFSSVLYSFSLERNEDKDLLLDYFEYSELNKIDKCWKKIEYQNTAKNPKLPKRHFYLNHLISYKGKIKDNKLYYTFIIGFYKSKYFYKLEEYPYYKLEQSNIHQILILYKDYPEIILFSINKYIKDKLFLSTSKEFIEKYYQKSLMLPFFENQLYYFYALILLNDYSFLKKPSIIQLVLNSNNQILLSYYVKNKLFEGDLKQYLKNSEEFWFFNYNLLCSLFENNDIEESELDELIDKLIPKNCKKDIQKENYRKFYKTNIKENHYLVYDVDKIYSQIKHYIELRK